MRYARYVTPAVMVLVALWGGSTVPAQSGPEATHTYPNPYRLIEHPLTYPAGRSPGQVFGLDIDRNGKDIWVFERCTGPCTASPLDPILKFDASGKFVRSFGAGMFAFPHGLYVDQKGNVWVADGVAGGPVPKDFKTGAQVFKFSPEGKLLLTLGTAGVTGNTATTFNMPADVVVARDGSVFVADGGTAPDNNARIVKFAKDGTFIKAWGTKGKGPGQFSEPHSLALDSRGRLFVGDRRGSDRIQIFEQNGTFLDEWKQFGSPSEIYIDRHDVMYVSDLFVKPGVHIGSAKDGKVTAFIPDDSKNQELVVADKAGNVWTGLTAGKAVRKFVKTSGP